MIGSLPAQVPLPGGPELLLLLVLVAVVLFGVLGRWLYRDATTRGSNWAWQWAVGVPFMFFFGLVPGLLLVIIYLLVRGERVDDEGG